MHNRLCARTNWQTVVTVVFLVVFLTASWFVIAWQVRTRTRNAMTEGKFAAREIWGQKIVQESPRIAVEGDPGQPIPLSRVKGNVDIDMDYRKRGLVYLTGFKAYFKTAFTFVNEGGQPAPVQFFLPLPESGELFTDLGVEGVDNTTESSSFGTDGLVWNGWLETGAEKTLTVSYRIRGMDNFIFNPPGSQVMKEFDLAVAVSSLAEIDYPSSATAPTSKAEEEGKTVLRWQFKDVRSDFSVGLTLPPHPDYSRDIVRLNSFGPILLIGLLCVFIAVLYFKDLEVDAVSLCLMSFAFFIVFPLSAYLVTFMGLAPAYLIASATGGLTIIIFIIRRFELGAAFAAVLLSLFLFLGIFPVALMTERLTGLLSTIGFLILIIAFMELYLASEHKTCAPMAQDSGEGAYQWR